MMRRGLVAAAVLTLAGCAGKDGSSCTVTDDGQGVKTLRCSDGTTATVSDGATGATGPSGSSCTVSDNQDGTKTISCQDGTTVVVSDGADGAAGTGCTVTDALTTVTVSCGDGTTVTWNKPRLGCVLAFDDAYAVLGDGANPETFYGTFGVHFDNAAGYGLIGGMGNGDPGNWDIQGSNGPAAWGLWQGVHAISFDVPTNGLSVDFLRAFDDMTVVVTASLAGAEVETQTFSLAGAFDVATVNFSNRLDRISWSTAVIGTGLDNVRYNGWSCPPGY